MPATTLDTVLADLRRLDFVARLKAIDGLKRQLETLEQRTQCEMPGHLRWLTPQWASLRNRCLKRDHYRCTVCGSINPLRMHHTDYRRIGTPSEINDVTTRCARCHSWAHRRTPSGYRERTGQLRIAA